jgi:predicted alpha/beta-fold hydrolase
MLARGWAVISYSRRGHGVPLAQPIFNTVGCQRTFRRVLELARARFPELPLFAVGSSAGSSMVARYLGDSGEESAIAGAALISPGYDFEAAQLLMPELGSRLCVIRLKNYFLWPNAELLQSHCAQTFARLAGATTVREWHDAQFRFAGHESRAAYMAEHDPAPVLADIRVPVLYLSAMDDPLFPRDLTQRFRGLADVCDTATVVQTRRGGHVSFMEGLWPRPWDEHVIEDFLIEALARECRRRRATERPSLLS